MDSTIDCDHKIIVIDSSVANFPDTSLSDFYIDLDEPLRNVYKIKIITILANIKNSGNVYNKDLESIYINLNNYDRLITKSTIRDSNGKRGNNYYFDSLIIETASLSANSTIKNDYNHADVEYFINPIEPQLKRLRVTLFDKSNNIIQFTNIINRFVIKLSIYYNNRKTTRL